MNAQPPHRYAAVVFDMDGLLLDTEIVWQGAEEQLFAAHGAVFTREDKLAVIGTSFDVTARYFAQRLGRPEDEGPALVEEMVLSMYALLQEDVAGRPGALELVARLRGRLPLALASNSPRRLVDAALTTSHLTGVFDVIVTSDDALHSKPAPDIYLLACERLGVAPERVLALEDSAAGVASAKAAGCTAVPQLASDVPPRTVRSTRSRAAPEFRPRARARSRATLGHVPIHPRPAHRGRRGARMTSPPPPSSTSAR
jgi:HAD superfamily hydrolase (TIGR01509 family)